MTCFYVSDMVKPSLVCYGGGALDLKSSLQDGTVWWFKELPAKLGADVKIYSAEWICDIGFTWYAEHVWGHLVSVAPCPM